MEMENFQEPTLTNIPTVVPKLWTLDFILIFLSSFAMYVSFHTLMPTLPVYILQYSGTTGLTGLALGVLTTAAVISRPITGWALDNFGRKLIYIFGLLVFVLPTGIYIFMIPVIALLIFRFIQGIGWGMCSTATGTIASDIVPNERLAEGMGIFSLTQSFSLALSPALGLWLVDAFSFQVLFIISSFLTFISIFLALKVKYPVIEKQIKRTKLVFFERSALRPALVILFVSITYSSLLSFLAIFALQQGLAKSAFFFTILALTTVISRPIGGRLVDQLGGRGYDLVVIPGIIFIMLAMPVIAQTTSYLFLILGGVLYGLGFGFVQPTMLALSLSSVAKNKMGAANATYWTFFDIGIAAGSILWGIIAEIYGYSTMFNLTAISGILALMAYLINKK